MIFDSNASYHILLSATASDDDDSNKSGEILVCRSTGGTSPPTTTTNIRSSFWKNNSKPDRRFALFTKKEKSSIIMEEWIHWSASPECVHILEFNHKRNGNGNTAHTVYTFYYTAHNTCIITANFTTLYY
jgi:hypothetical protein